MTDPFQPSLPAKGEPGRLSAASVLQPGWPCRHCRRPLRQRVAAIVCNYCDFPPQRAGA